MICHFYGNFKAEVLGLSSLKLDLRRGHVIRGSSIHVIKKCSRNTDCNSDEEFCCCFYFVLLSEVHLYRSIYTALDLPRTMFTL